VNGALATFPEGVVPLHVGEPLHDPPLVNLEPTWQPGLDQIHHQLEPILLRRTRQEVLKDLPERTDQIFRAERASARVDGADLEASTFNPQSPVLPQYTSLSILRCIYQNCRLFLI
jgi:hypothetical protein